MITCTSFSMRGFFCLVDILSGVIRGKEIWRTGIAFFPPLLSFLLSSLYTISFPSRRLLFSPFPSLFSFFHLSFSRKTRKSQNASAEVDQCQEFCANVSQIKFAAEMNIFLCDETSKLIGFQAHLQRRQAFLPELFGEVLNRFLSILSDGVDVVVLCWSFEHLLKSGNCYVFPAHLFPHVNALNYCDCERKMGYARLSLIDYLSTLSIVLFTSTWCTGILIMWVIFLKRGGGGRRRGVKGGFPERHLTYTTKGNLK